MTEVVRLVIGKGKSVDQQKRYKLVARSGDLRDIVEKTNKGLFDLMADAFGGWPYVLQALLKESYPRLTKDDVATMINEWLADGNDYEELGKLLMTALENGRFVKIPKNQPESEGGDEGNPTAQD